MNGLEAAYAAELERRKAAGELADFAFEPETFLLPGRVRYTPDFRVLLADGHVAFVDVKGFREGTGVVKIRVAAAVHWMYDWLQVTRVAKRDGGGWAEERF